jgi:hypothetical protein
MFASTSDYGPFAPVVGYGGAIMAAAGALFLMWGGKMQKWRPPDEDLPGTGQGIVLLLCGVGMVLEWYFATPAAIPWFLAAVAILAIACIVCFLRYSGLLGTFTYIKKEVAGENSTRDVRILGGRELLPDAEKKRKKLGVDIQTLLEGAAYKVDMLWSREARQWVKQRVLLFFILTLVFGTFALTGAGFATQVLLSKKAAATVVRPADAPPPTDKPGDSPGPKTDEEPKKPEWHTEDENGNKYVVVWRMDPACHRADPNDTKHLCNFTHTQMSFAGDNTPYDHWNIKVEPPGPVVDVLCETTGTNEFNEVKGVTKGDIDGKFASCSGWINGGDADIKLTAWYKQKW